MLKTVLFLTIQFSIQYIFSFICPTDRTLLDSTNSSQSGHGSNCNEGVLLVPQSSRITGALLSDLLSGIFRILAVGCLLILCSEAIRVFCCPSRLGHLICGDGGFIHFQSVVRTMNVSRASYLFYHWLSQLRLQNTLNVSL